MSVETIPVAVASGAHPVVRSLAAFPIALFTGALLTDVAYWRTAVMMWADFSAWLLALGMAMGVIAAVAGLVAWGMRGRLAGRRAGWPVAIGSLAVLIVAFVNNLVHSRDAWTSVVPEGIVLSAVTVLLILATIWAGAALGRPRVVLQGVRA